MTVLKIYEPPYVSKKSFGVLTEFRDHPVTYQPPLTRFRSCDKASSSQVEQMTDEGDKPSAEQRALIKITSLTNRTACVRIVNGQISNSCG